MATFRVHAGQLAAGPANRRWRWRIEPGMEEAFRDLLGWFLPSQRDAEIQRDDSP
ncbi:MAG TPA: hypothetical protein VJ578_02460 [Dehalococcoidia bacterium]|nr:hypothetical protein [Dehalococcoidia bacterium]